LGRQEHHAVFANQYARSFGVIVATSFLTPLDSNHRLLSHHIVLQMSDEDLAKYNVQRLAASQNVWIAS